MREKCIELSEVYLQAMLQKRNEVVFKPWGPLRVLRILVLNHRVRKAAKLLYAVAEAGSLPVGK